MTPSIPPRETLTVEFKSDRKRLPDHDLVEAVCCLANAEGGELWLGVEDDGAPTGLHTDHLQLGGLPGMIAARTSPSLRVTVMPLMLRGVTVACLTVPKAHGEVATTGGVYMRRRLKSDGEPVRNFGGVYAVMVTGEAAGLKIEDDHALVWLDPRDAVVALRHDAHAWAVAAWMRTGG